MHYTFLYYVISSLNFCSTAVNYKMFTKYSVTFVKRGPIFSVLTSFRELTMPGDKKLETADELHELFSDPERLKNYRYSQPVISDTVDNEKFHLDLPFDEIKAIVESCRGKFFAAVPEGERSGLKWEHVGSTSIKGMPGTMMPDSLIIVPEFPPSKGVIQALLNCDYYFSSSAALDPKDLWWMHIFTDGLLKDHKLVLHIVTEDNVAAKILRETRDMCNTEEWAFEDYKEAKMSAYRDASGEFKNYKIGKGKNSKLLTMLREKYSSSKQQ